MRYGFLLMDYGEILLLMIYLLQFISNIFLPNIEINYG